MANRNGVAIFSGDGLERQLKFFNELEGGMCATCAPGDQEKSGERQYLPLRFSDIVRHKQRLGEQG
jgi:hypothetical protein